MKSNITEWWNKNPVDNFYIWNNNENGRPDLQSEADQTKPGEIR